VEHKVFHAHDGYGIRIAALRGIRFAIVSGRRSKVVPHRARELGIRDVYQRVPDKIRVLEALLLKHRLTPAEVCCIGDDEPDLGILKTAGFSAAPANAVRSVREVVDYVTKARGGDGAVREVLDMILKQQRIKRA
jgi:3-deoxy-D-manno-octulosonate 8-phosphate phosphatase (KDO 8-P phosphatase)